MNEKLLNRYQQMNELELGVIRMVDKKKEAQKEMGQRRTSDKKEKEKGS